MREFKLGDKLIYQTQYQQDTEPSQEVIKVAPDGHAILIKPLLVKGVTVWISQISAKRVYVVSETPIA
jgi:hypothetical protein